MPLFSSPPLMQSQEKQRRLLGCKLGRGRLFAKSCLLNRVNVSPVGWRELVSISGQEEQAFFQMLRFLKEVPQMQIPGALVGGAALKAPPHPGAQAERMICFETGNCPQLGSSAPQIGSQAVIYFFNNLTEREC